MFILDVRLAALSSSDLLDALDRVAADGRELTADLIALLAECDGRKMYALEGYESLFEFCVRRLRLSESQAYHRIQAARAARDFPLVLERLRAGRVTMTAVALLREHLTDANHRQVLDWAEGRRKREVEMYVRSLDPKPDVASSLRRLASPQTRPAEAANMATVRQPTEVPMAPRQEADAEAPLMALVSSTWKPDQVADTGVLARTPQAATASQVGGAPTRRAEIRPLSPARYSLHVTISEETRDKLRRAQDLLRHTGATDAADVLDRALTLLVAQLERKKAGASRRQGRRGTSAVPDATLDSGGPGPEETGDVSGATNAPPPKRAGGAADARRTVLVPQHPPEAEPPAGPTVGESKAQVRAEDEPPRRLPRTRYIPAAVRRAVWERDRASCAYVSPSGVRCSATGRLEFHHRLPFAEGGEATVDNTSLRCTRHNTLEAERWFNFDQAEFGLNRSRMRRAPEGAKT